MPGNPSQPSQPSQCANAMPPPPPRRAHTHNGVVQAPVVAASGQAGSAGAGWQPGTGTGGNTMSHFQATQAPGHGGQQMLQQGMGMGQVGNAHAWQAQLQMLGAAGGMSDMQAMGGMGMGGVGMGEQGMPNMQAMGGMGGMGMGVGLGGQGMGMGMGGQHGLELALMGIGHIGHASLAMAQMNPAAMLAPTTDALQQQQQQQLGFGGLALANGQNQPGAWGNMGTGDFSAMNGNGGSTWGRDWGRN